MYFQNKSCNLLFMTQYLLSLDCKQLADYCRGHVFHFYFVYGYSVFDLFLLLDLF